MQKLLRCGFATAILLSVVGNGLAAPTIVVVDARTSWMWFQSRWPSRHLALFPGGPILAETWSNSFLMGDYSPLVTFPLLDPPSGAWSLLPGQFQNGPVGVAPNPIIW